MDITLGIDAGGTYTDAVLVAQSSGEVRHKAKALTTPHDFSRGIASAIEHLRAQVGTQKHTDIFQGIRCVSLSTTLATNAIVEGHGGRVGLLLIGYDERLLHRDGFMQRLPVERIFFIAGGHDVKGEEVCGLDMQGARQAISDSYKEVDAFAVSGYFSVMNPDHEMRLREMIAERASLSVVCGHELSSKLNALKRLSTAVLNARLLPIIQRLLDAVRQVLHSHGIEAPLMVVKGDGTLIHERTARQRPIETILSGPAASAIGGQFLAGATSAVVVDMGGTTTDIARLEDGMPWINPAGATVGGWETHIEAVDLRTIGLGGDSYIRVGRDKSVYIGPQRVIPLCRLGVDWPEVSRILEGALHSHESAIRNGGAEFFTIARSADNLQLTGPEKELLRLLGDGPQAPSKLAAALEGHDIPSRRLEALGIIRKSGLTPTDILWRGSDQIGGDRAAALAGTRLIARQLGLPTDELARTVRNMVEDKVAQEILDKLLHDETGDPLSPAPNGGRHLIASALGSRRLETLKCRIEVHPPIVAIGAPVEAFIPQVAAKLNTRCIIPPHAEVGSAVGAAVASVRHTVEVLVQPHMLGAGTVEYLIHSPQGRERGGASFNRAVRRAEQIATELARKSAYRAGARQVSVKVDRKEVPLGKLSEMTVRASATGLPNP